MILSPKRMAFPPKPATPNPKTRYYIGVGIISNNVPLGRLSVVSIIVMRSSMGKGLGFLGNHALAFVIMIAVVRKLRPIAFLHENTRNFDYATLQMLLPEYQLHHTFLRPEEYGCPAKRTRSYCAMIRGDHDLVHGPPTPYSNYSGPFFIAVRADCSEVIQFRACSPEVYSCGNCAPLDQPVASTNPCGGIPKPT